MNAGRLMPVVGASSPRGKAIDAGSDVRKDRKPPTCNLQVQFIRSNGFAVLIRQRSKDVRSEGLASFFYSSVFLDLIEFFRFQLGTNFVGHFCSFESERKFARSR